MPYTQPTWQIWQKPTLVSFAKGDFLGEWVMEWTKNTKEQRKNGGFTCNTNCGNQNMFRMEKERCDDLDIYIIHMSNVPNP